MFKCENEYCNLPDKLVPHRQPINKIVTERREKQYEKKIFKRKKLVDIILVDGWEIVKEIAVCPKCFKKLTGRKPKMLTVTPRIPKVKKFSTRPPRKRKKWVNPNHKNSKKTQSSKETKQQKKPIVEKINSIPIIK